MPPEDATVQPDDARTPRPAPTPSRGMRLDRVLGQKVPPPKGRGIVLAIVGVLVLVSVVITFTQETPMTRRLREEPRERTGVPPVATDGDLGTEPPSSAVLHVPEGLPVPLARTLLLAATSLRGAPTGVDGLAVATAALKELVEAARTAPEESQGAVRGFVVERLVEAVKRGTHARSALESALEIQLSAAEALPLVEAASVQGLADDGAGPAAVLFFESLPDRGGEKAAAGLDVVVLDSTRPMALRVQAAKARPRPLPDILLRLAADPATPSPLRSALSE
jgi:hypothetical protein